MNILILNHYAGSEKYGMEFRPFYLGRELVKLGHNVTVIASDCSHLRKVNPIVRDEYLKENIEGVEYLFVKTIKYKKNDLKRFLNMMGYLRFLKKNSKMIYNTYKPDVVIASSTYPYDVKAAKRIANHGKNVKVCYEIHDLWPLSLIEIHHISKNNPYMKSLQKAENYAYETVDFVVSILPHTDIHIKELGYNNVPFYHIPNGVVIDNQNEIKPPKEIESFINELKADSKQILMYLGGFSKANALEDLIESAKFMDENIHIIMIGDGPCKEEYKEHIQTKNLKNITICDSVSKTQVQSVLRLADVLYIGARRSTLYKYGVGMNKLFDYMLSKRPILCGIEASNDIVSDSNCGMTIKPEDPKAIAKGASVLFSLPKAELIALGENGYNYIVKNHDYKNLAKMFEKVILEVGENNA